MLKQYRTFTGVLLVILLSILIVMAMYTYTINTSLNTVQEDIQANNLNRMRVLVANLDRSVAQLDLLATALESDRNVGLLPSVDLMDNYDQIKLILDLTDKLNLQSFSQGWSNQISIYSPLIHQWIGASAATSSLPSPEQLAGEGWSLDPSLGQFTTFRDHSSYAIRVTFPASNVREMLDSAKLGTNDPFFYRPGNAVVANRSADAERLNKVLSALEPSLGDRKEGTTILKVGGKDYMTNFMRSDTLGWYVIDYLPLNEALAPIAKTKSFFYAACGMLFAAGVAIAIFLFRKVQIPIVTLLRGVRLLKHGDFSYRIRRISRNEFDFLYDSFNDMAAQIEELIEKVYKEKIVSREALVKQLQAQINPHFLYNCLFFINNMTRLGNEEAVTAMTKNLAEYFRYSTRLDKPLTTLDKELGVVVNYLEIQCLRMTRLRYEIDVPDSMLSLIVPKLLLQPLVENSVVHGIENKRNAGWVRVSGEEDESRYRLVVEDDGKGISKEKILELSERIKLPLEESMGCALWNIGQRMNIHFAAPAGMSIHSRDDGGLRVELHWSKPAMKEE